MKYPRESAMDERDDRYFDALMLFDLAVRLENEEFADDFIRTHNLNCTSPDYPMNK